MGIVKENKGGQMSYFDNLRVIAQGGGSDQARMCGDGQCKICSEELNEDEEERNENL